MAICHVCAQPGASIPDPCCSAPDCESGLDYAHLVCLPGWRREEERRWQEQAEEYMIEALEHSYRMAALRLGVDPATAQSTTWIVQRNGRAS